MILERHYDEEALIAILNSGDDAVSRDAHLACCATCSQNLEAYQVMTEVLGEKNVWDFADTFDEGAARGAEAIRAFAEKMETEDADAKELVDELVALPRQWWMTTIEADERYRHLGVARRLVEVSEVKIDTMPAEAVDLALAAITIANAHEGTAEVLQVRGAAYRQHAYALFYTGEFGPALESVDDGEAALAQHPAAAYDLARLDIVRSLIFTEQKRYDDALKIARRVTDVFRAFGDTTRVISARKTEAYLFADMRQYVEALEILEDLRRRYEREMSVGDLAGLLANIGECQSHLGSVSDALQSLQLAAELYDEMGNKPEAVRSSYNVAMLISAHGQRAEAKKRLKAVQADLARLGMVHHVVVVGLDIAEIALLENDFEEVEDLCRAAMRKFETAGVAYSREALTALTFLREAAEQRRATQATLWHVRTYIRRLPDQPALLFAPAPLPPA